MKEGLHSVSYMGSSFPSPQSTRGLEALHEIGAQ